jgi:hypothetical protein
MAVGGLVPSTIWSRRAADMRTATDLKDKWLAEIPLILERTGMWTRTGEEADTLCRRLLEDLCFLDERDPAAALADLQRYGSTGVAGAFRDWLGKEARCDAEVVSVYAECFHRLGYLTVDRLLDWAQLADAARAGLGDLPRSEVEALYGEPSLVVDGRIGCYVSADGWLYVDYQGPLELVRDVRIPAQTFDGGVFVTPYGEGFVGGGL